jgi:hypothetical protein
MLDGGPWAITTGSQSRERTMMQKNADAPCRDNNGGETLTEAQVVLQVARAM